MRLLSSNLLKAASNPWTREGLRQRWRLSGVCGTLVSIAVAAVNLTLGGRQTLVKITVKKDGSLRLEGDLTLCDAEGNPYDLAGRTTISLCRCGASENKPFCDGSHRKISFQSEVKATQLPPLAPKPPAA